MRLTSYLTCFDLAEQVNLLIKHKQSGWIQTSQIGGQLYRDTSPNEVGNSVFSEKVLGFHANIKNSPTRVWINPISIAPWKIHTDESRESKMTQTVLRWFIQMVLS